MAQPNSAEAHQALDIKSLYHFARLGQSTSRQGSVEADCSACHDHPGPSTGYWSGSTSQPPVPLGPGGLIPPGPSTTSPQFYNFSAGPHSIPSASASHQSTPTSSYACTADFVADCCDGMPPELCCDETNCADDPHALPPHAAGAAALTAAGKWWDAVLDGCEACANQDYSVDPSDCAACGSSQACPNPRSIQSGSSSRVPTPWPAQLGEPCCPDWTGLLDECTDSCFDVNGTNWPIPGATDDCPDCWHPQPDGTFGTAAATPNPALAQSHPHLTPATTPAGSIGSPAAGLSELMKGLDQRTVQEILDCCYCAPSATADPNWSPSAHFSHTACPTGPHEHPTAAAAFSATPTPTPVNAFPLSQPLQPPPFDPSHHFADQTFAALVSQFPATALPPAPPPGPFACQWGGCRMSFGEQDLLVQHVTSAHLGVCVPTSVPAAASAGGASGFGLVEPLQAWENSVGLAAVAQPLSGASTPVRPAASAAVPVQPAAAVVPAAAPAAAAAPAPDALTVQQATSTLLKHLIDDHLAKLEPGLAQALGKELQASAEAATKMAAAGKQQGAVGRQQQQEGAAGGALEQEADARSTSSTHTHSTEDPQSAKHAGHSHHTHPHPHPHPHPHAHSHQHGHAHHPHHGPHRHPPTRHHHAHPYGVAARSNSNGPAASTSSPVTPTPTADGAHPCKWKGCGLRFETSALLMSHLSLAHVGSGKAGYTCEWEGCERAGGGEGKGFAQRQKVMRHLQTHTGDRPFVCEVCQKSFSEAMTLTQHMRVHTNERPYACTHRGCDKAFALASALTIHLRTHSGDKPFKCPYPGCGSAFAESSNLSKHVRTHKGEKAYGCDECGKAFARSDQLARHKKIHEKARAGAKGEEEGKADGKGEGEGAGMEGVVEVAA